MLASTLISVLILAASAGPELLKIPGADKQVRRLLA